MTHPRGARSGDVNQGGMTHPTVTTHPRGANHPTDMTHSRGTRSGDANQEGMTVGAEQMLDAI